MTVLYDLAPHSGCRRSQLSVRQIGALPLASLIIKWRSWLCGAISAW